MTDMGFGLVDRRTIVVILMVLVLVTLVGFKLPFDLTSPLQLIIDLSLFTGYMYVARSVFRFPFALILGIKAIRAGSYDYEEKYYHFLYGVTTSRKTRYCGLLNQSTWEGLKLLALLDRLYLVAIVVLATIPGWGDLVLRVGGVIGVCFMLAIYLIVGTFSFVLEDALKSASDAHERLVNAAGSQPYINFPSVIETRPASNWDR